jgi:hypothetical protein
VDQLDGYAPLLVKIDQQGQDVWSTVLDFEQSTRGTAVATGAECEIVAGGEWNEGAWAQRLSP